MGYAKVVHKNKERKELKKMDKCPNNQNNRYLDARLKRERDE